MSPRRSLRFLPATLCLSCELRLLSQSRRPLSTSASVHARNDLDDNVGLDAFAQALRPPPAKSGLGRLGDQARLQQQRTAQATPAAARAPTQAPSVELSKIAGLARNEAAARPSGVSAIPESHHLHVYSTKHNTHVTFTSPSRSPLISLSTGNIGFRKGNRGSFDAAYQLMSFVMARIQEKGFIQDMKHLEVLLRGHGAGREASTKALFASEGKHIKAKVKRVTDATRLKFGGTRSQNARRL